jgi:cell division initiation protein
VKFTPLDIRHAEFNGQVSGYAKRGVREFLAQVADDAEEYERQIRALQERVTTLEAQVTDLRQGEESLRRAVVSAERIGNEVKASADREAQLMIREATSSCSSINSGRCCKATWKALTGPMNAHPAVKVWARGGL